MGYPEGQSKPLAPSQGAALRLRSEPRPARVLVQTASLAASPGEVGFLACSPETEKVITQVLSFLSLGLFGLEENSENKLKT